MSTASALPTRSQTAHSLRLLYFVRAGFSVIWVALVFVLASSASSKPTVAAGILLVIYPLWDAVATIFDIRASGTTGSKLPQWINVAVGVIVAVILIIVLPTGFTAALLVFGIWAFVSGAVQLFLGIRRLRLGAQWPMVISGGLSVIAGIVFAVTASSPTAGLTTLAGYSAFGAFWYLVGAIWLTRSVKAAAQ